MNSPSLLNRLVSVKPEEVRALLISCAYFFLVLCAYYIIRPIRNEMMIANGVQNIQWLILITLAAMVAIAPIFGWLTSRFRTKQFMSYCTLFFASHLILFYFLFDVDQRSISVTRAFYIWVGVFNMFIVSLFWSFMNDIYTQTQSKRLFAFIGAGGTAGAICGPIVTTSLVASTGIAPLMILSAVALACSVMCINWLTRWQNQEMQSLPADQQNLNKKRDDPNQQSTTKGTLKGGKFAGITLLVKSPYLMGISAFILLYAMCITLVQIQQAELIQATLNDPTQRTRLFSSIDLAVNIITLFVQIFVTSHIIRLLGFRATFMLIPLGITLGFALMATTPILAIMIGVDIFRRAGDYAVMKPTREMLFNIVSREEKYKVKNFIDTTVLRSGNVLGAFSHSALKSLGAAGTLLGGISVAIGIVWLLITYWLGLQFKQKRDQALHKKSHSHSL